MDGAVVSRAAFAGEIIAPGGTLVSVDSFPSRIVEANIVYIADHAQHTPINVSTKDERVNTVYGVEILLSNPEGLLKAGMAADAVSCG